MAGEAEIGELRPGRRWMIASAVGVAGLMGLSIVVDEPVGEQNDLALTDGELLRGESGAPRWRGALSNLGAEACRDLSVEIRFLDRRGALTGEVSARASWLAAGSRLDLEAALPEGAVELQLYALRWRTRDASIELGPFRPRPLVWSGA